MTQFLYHINQSPSRVLCNVPMSDPTNYDAHHSAGHAQCQWTPLVLPCLWRRPHKGSNSNNPPEMVMNNGTLGQTTGREGARTPTTASKRQRCTAPSANANTTSTSDTPDPCGKHAATSVGHTLPCHSVFVDLRKT